MTSIRMASVVLGLFVFTRAYAADPGGRQSAELEAIKAELKPLRERAVLEKDVITARHALDEAYRAYWESVRVAMVRLAPDKKKLIQKEIDFRKSLTSIRGSSQTEKNSSAKRSD